MIVLRLAMGCAYGLGALFVFRKAEELCDMLIVQLAYVVGLLFLVGWALQAVLAYFGDLTTENAPYLWFSFIGTGAVISIFNLPAIKCVVSSSIGKLARTITSADTGVVRKQYSLAAGAEAHGDLDEAARLYRQEIQMDPKDAEVHLRLAEVLLKQKLPDGALDEFRTAIKMLKDKRDRASAMFRLAEVLDDVLNQPTAARDISERIMRECPGTAFAAHARKRWGS